MTTALEQNTLLIDAYVPEFDETRIEHLVIDGPTDVVYETMRELDFLMVHSPITDLAMFVRTLPDKIGRLTRRNEPPAPPLPALKLAAMFDREGFERPGVGGRDHRNDPFDFGGGGQSAQGVDDQRLPGQRHEGLRQVVSQALAAPGRENESRDTHRREHRQDAR